MIMHNVNPCEAEPNTTTFDVTDASRVLTGAHRLPREQATRAGSAELGSVIFWRGSRAMELTMVAWAFSLPLHALQEDSFI